MFNKRQFIFSAITFVCTSVGGVAMVLNHMQTQAYEKQAHLRAELVLQFAKASRTYTKKTLRPAVEQITDEMVFEAMSSTFVSNRIVSNFREKMPEYAYRQATINPLNLKNKADDYEADLVAQFDADRNLDSLSGYRTIDDKEYYYTATPIVVETKCLKCHDSVENVLATQPQIIERYGDEHGFDWTVGDVVAAQV
ncbi:MAG: Tll0287-like domain-containing protein, partial [Phycisphaerales bacterium]